MPQERAKATRTAVLLAAARVFESRGFAAATISDILAEAGVTRGALYFHFDSKEGLAREIVSGHVSWQGRGGDRVRNPIQRLIDHSHAFGMALRTDPIAQASIRLTLERNACETEVLSSYGGWVADLEAILTEARAAHLLLDQVSPDSAVRLISSVMLGAQLISECTTGRADLADRIEEIWRLLLPVLVEPTVIDDGLQLGGSSYLASGESASPDRAG